MPRGLTLTEYERGQITAFHESNVSMNIIANRIGRSRAVVQNFLKNPAGYHTIKRKGVEKKLTTRDERRIANMASNSSKSCRQIQRECNLNVSVTTIWRSLKRCPHIVRSKLQPAPRLLPRHIEKRLAFARERMNQDWNIVSLFFIILCF